MKNKFDPASKISVNHHFRIKRFNYFLSKLTVFNNQDTIKILDVGGTESFWEQMNFINQPKVHITLLNLEESTTRHEGFKSVIGNACDLSQYGEKEFDLVFSNSVIEHLFTFSNQIAMANEVQRVGKFYYIQTPNLYFPIEPHWMFPFFQFLPFPLKVLLTKHFNMGHYKKANTTKIAQTRVKEVKLLTEKTMRELFPGSSIYKEKFTFFTKSITAHNFRD